MNPNELSIEEVKLDLDNTTRDRECLIKICESLEIFITQPGDEDRGLYRLDLMKFQSLLRKTTELQLRIKTIYDTKNEPI